MQFEINREPLLKSLNFVQGVVEKKNTLPILSNVLIIAEKNTLTITATDLDIIFFDSIDKLKIMNEGKITTSATVLYDILRKIPAGSEIKFELVENNKLSLKSDNSNFNLLCLPADNFPLVTDDFGKEKFNISSKNLLRILNKTKISVSNDDTRHYLNGIFFHPTSIGQKKFLTAVATDSHRLSSSSTEFENDYNFSPLILPKKTAYMICTLIEENENKILIQTTESKIKFTIGKTILISKVIDGKFPDYKKVIPQDNKNKLVVSSKDLTEALERVTSVSIDKREGVKLSITSNNVELSVNSANSGDGKESLKANYDGTESLLSFNSKYLIDIARQISGANIKFMLSDKLSPTLMLDEEDSLALYLLMPMHI